MTEPDEVQVLIRAMEALKGAVGIKRDNEFLMEAMARISDIVRSVEAQLANKPV